MRPPNYDSYDNYDFFKVSQTHRLKLIWIGQILHEAQIGASKEAQTPCMDIKLSLV